MSDPNSGQGDPQLAAILGSLQQSVSAIPQLAANLSSLQQTVTAIPQLVASLSSLQESIAALIQGQRDLSQGHQDLTAATQQQQQAIQKLQQQAITSIVQGNHATSINDQLQPSPTPSPSTVVSHQSSVQTSVSDSPSIATRTDQATFEESQNENRFKYDLSKSGFHTFVVTISKAAACICSSGPTSVCHFTVADSDNPVNIIKNHSQFGIDSIRTQCATFITDLNVTPKVCRNTLIYVRRLSMS